MNKEILKKFGFEKEVKAFEMQICPFCRKQVKRSEFKNEKSLREFLISGLCQNC